jgi:hypothetical protein
MGITKHAHKTSGVAQSKELGPGRDDVQFDEAVHRRALLKLDLILLTT